MNIIAERVTGHVFVVAPDETKALEAFQAGNTVDTESSAVAFENDTNHYRRIMADDEPQLNTYRITVTADQVH